VTIIRSFHRAPGAAEAETNPQWCMYAVCDASEDDELVEPPMFGQFD
jgi:hypothetical protein